MLDRSHSAARRALLLCGLVAIAATACGTPPANDDTPDAGDQADSGAPPAVDQCQNATDLDWLKSQVNAEQTGRELARAEAGNCGLGCLSDPAPDRCAIRCMKQVKGVQLTDGCAGCYGGIVLCTINNCLPKCIDDPQAAQCKQCQADKGCDTTFYACTGNLD